MDSLDVPKRKTQTTIRGAAVMERVAYKNFFASHGTLLLHSAEKASSAATGVCRQLRRASVSGFAQTY
jgi:hypothetical protein